MKNENKNVWKSILVITAVLSVIAIAMVGTAAAKSVFLAADHHTGQFDAWNINPGCQINYQDTYILQHSTDPSGIACDAIPRDAPVLFISSEFSAGIEMVNPITLEYMGVSSGPGNLAGIDVDDVDNIVYTLLRQTNDLYIYSWDSVAQTLTQLAVIDLPGMSYGFGIALDDSRDILWVSDTPNSMVRAYDVDVAGIWNNIVEIPGLSRQLSLQVVDVAVDSKRNMVYTVGGWVGSTLLSKYDVGAATEETIDLGDGGIGVAVDEDTGCVYVTRGTSSSSDDIQVWNPSTSPFTLVQDTDRIGNPAGICVCNVGYNPLNLSKSDGLAEDECVSPGANINYDICYDNMRNAFDLHNVVINDTLPAETSFISASDGGTHNPVTHTVTWNIGTLSAGAAEDCVQLVVRVDPATLPETTIINYCTIDSDETPPTTISEDTVTCKQNPLWQEINKELDALITNVSAADMPNIIKNRLIDKLEYAKALKENAHEECEADNFDAATKKLGVAKSQVGSFASMVRITRRISAEDKASFLADAASITGKIDKLIEYIETKHSC